MQRPLIAIVLVVVVVGCKGKVEETTSPTAPPTTAPPATAPPVAPAGGATFEEARAAVREAATKRDYDTLARYMADDFMFSIVDEASRTEALRLWRATPALLDDVGAVLKRCKREGDLQICGKAGQLAAWFQQRDGRWIMTSFVAGD